MNLLRQSLRLTGALLSLPLVAMAGGAQKNTLTAIGNQTACPGSTVIFTTTAGGTKPYQFTWEKNGVVLSGQHTNSLTLSDVSSIDAATYTVILKGGANSVTNSGTLTLSTGVSAAPLSDLLRFVGSTAVFSTTASGSGPFSYVWQKDGANIAGQSGSSLVLTNLALGDSGTYSVIVSGTCGSPVTNSANLTVDTCFPAVDVMVVIDRSGSMTGAPYFDALAACSNFVKNLYFTTNGDQAGLVSFNSSATLNQTLTNSLSQLDKSIAAVPGAGGETSISLGLQTAQAELISARHRSQSLPVIVLMSDGNPTGSDNTSNALYWAGQAKNAGTLVFTVGLGTVNASLLRGIASTTNDYSFTTNSAQLTALFNAVSTEICRPPTNILVMGLSNLTVCAGNTAGFGVTVAGCDSYRYQWFRNGSPLTGQTNSTLTLDNVAVADSGIYSVAVLTDCQNVTNSAILTVNASTSVSTPLLDQTVCPGQTAQFSVGAAGTDLTYQWYYGASQLMGQTSNVLTLNSVTAANAGTYSVVVTGTCSAVTNSATLTVNANTLVSMPPGDQTVCAGQAAQFSVSATGTDLTYQWYYGASQLVGQTSNVLTLNNVTAANAGTYSVVITGACGSAVTDSATLTVNAGTLVSTAPSDQTVCPGQTVQFSVGATGTDLTYQWYYGASQLTGQTNNVLTLNGVTSTNAGTYSVVITGACGTSVTKSSTLTVNASTLVSTPPVDETVCPGQTAQFGVGATGTDLTYQWYYGTSQLMGQTSNVLTLNSVTAANAGTYSVVITGTCGSTVTRSAILSVNQNVSVAPLPNVTNLIGGNALFTAVASGTGPFIYQWYQGANPLAGQTNSTLMLSNLQPANGGSYSVSVTGECGNAASAAFILNIDLPPVVSITYPTNGQVFIDPATFNVLATASDPDGTVTNVQFFSSTDGTNFTSLGQTSNTPYLTIASNLPAGSYTFIATATDNLGASAQSAPVTVQVVPTEPPDVTVIGNVTLNLQDGYQWLSNVVCNPMYSHAKAVRIYVHNITNSTIRVVNASGTNDGLPYVESPAAIEPGTCWTNIIMFFDPYGVQFSPTLTVELVDPPNAAGNPAGIVVPMFPAQMLRDGTFLIEFSSINSATYYVQYSSDMVNWNTAFPAITGTGQHMQWIDSGPPATTSLPAANVKRFYRVIQAQ